MDWNNARILLKDHSEFFKRKFCDPKSLRDIPRFCWPCFHLECFSFFWPPAPSEDNSIAYFEHRKEQTLASCKELCRAMANRRPVIDGPRTPDPPVIDGIITPFIG